MPEHPRPPALTVEELAAEHAAELPDREALSLLDPSSLSGGGLPTAGGAGGTAPGPGSTPAPTGADPGLADPKLTSNPLADKLVAVTPTIS